MFKNCWVEREQRFIIVPTDGVITEDIAQAKEKEGYTLYYVNLTDAELVERLHAALGVWAEMFRVLESEGRLMSFK